MDIENFKEQLIEDIKTGLYEKGYEVTVTQNHVDKLNDSYDAMTITPIDSNVGMNINLDSLYESMSEGRTYSEVASSTIDLAANHMDDMPVVDVSELTDYEQMKSKLAIEVVSTEANAELLAKIPHQEIEDLSIVYRFVLGSSEEGRSSILVTNNLIESMGVTPEQVHADALANAPEIRPAELKGMTQVMMEMIGPEQFELMGMPAVTDIRDEQMIVASVPDKINGAGVIAYPNFMENVAEQVGGDFYILPSSIHEVLVVPDNGNMSLGDLEAMVREVNATQVAPNERLTDNVYHYDANDHVFELGEKFEARQVEKLAAKEAEHDAKDSVLGELKAKKDEVAKQPKKDVIDRAAKAKDGKTL